jgi:DHA1 family multidrug/chloramphenicol efflux transport protein-like MFS transporter
MTNKHSGKILTLFPFLLVIYEISNYLANDAYLPAMPMIVTQLQTTNHLVQLTLTAFFLGNATMQLMLGPVSDKYGRRTVLLGGGLVFVLTTMICAFSTSIYTLLIARFFQGSAVTSMIVAGYATVHAMYTQVKAIKTLAWMSSITVLAPALGPLFGALILLVGGWRWIFIILTVWSALALIALYRYMPETCETSSEVPSKKIITQYYHVLINWNFMQPTLALSLLFSAMIAWIAAGPFLVIESFHRTSITFGLIQGMVFGSFIVGTQVVRRFIGKMPISQIKKTSIALACFSGFLSLAFSLVAVERLFDVVFPMMLFAFGSGIGFPVFNRMAIEGSEEPMGIKMALFSSFMGIGGLFGSIVISSFYNGTILSFALIIFVIACLLALLYFCPTGKSKQLLS